MANLLDLDDDEMFGNQTNSSAVNIDTQYHGNLSPINSDGQAQTFDDFFGVTSNEGNNNQGTNYEDDAFGISSENHGNMMLTSDLDLFISGSYNTNNTTECLEKPSGFQDDIFDSFMHINSNQTSGKAEHSSCSEDLVDLYPVLASNRDTNLEKVESAADDDFGRTAVSTTESTIETPKLEPVAIGHKMEDRSHGTREKSLGVKKSLEKSFEDLLQGLTDESDPDLDDMLSDVSVDSSSNLESLIRSQERTHQEHVMSVEKGSKPDVQNWFEVPPIPAVRPPEMDNVRDDAEDENTWEVVNEEEVAEDEKWEEEEEEKVEEKRDDISAAEMMNADKEYLRHGDSEMESETCTKNLIERQESETSQRSNASSGLTEGDDSNRRMDLDAVQDTSYLDVDVTKQKTNLRKKGSLAKRRKPSRHGRRSIIEEGENKLYQDTTEPRPEKDEEEEVDEGEDQDVVFAKEDMSPPHKKPTHPAMITETSHPLQQGPSDPSNMEKVSPIDSKVVKPPPGGVKLPTITPSQLKRSSKEIKEEITSPLKHHSPMKVVPPEKNTQSNDFDLSKLRKASSVDKDEDSTDSKQHAYEKPSLRSIPKVEGENKTKEETGVFSKPQLKSTPKVNSDNKGEEISSEEISTKGVFRKPSLRTASADTKTEDDNKLPYTGEFDVLKLRQAPRKGSESEDKTSSGLLESPVLRPAPKPTNPSKMDDSESHFFDKPPLRNTPKKNVESKPSETEQHTFTKPELRNVNKTKTSDARPDQDGHTFEKPSLRGTPPRTTKADELPTGKFDKPALRSVSRSSVSPEKEKTSTGKSGFEKPALKPVETIQKDPLDIEKNGSVEETEENKPLWFLQLRKTGSQSVEDTEKTRSSEPEWLQAARNKKAKALEIIQSKENQNQEVEKPSAPWVESNVLRKTPKSSPLQENNTNEENRQIFSTGRERRSSSGSNKDSDNVRDERSRSSSIGTGKDNYVPSWMKGHSAAVTPPRIITTSKPDLMKRPTDELPQWKKELAEKRKARKESEGLDPAVQNDETDSPGVPLWKQELSQRGLRAAQRAKAAPETSTSAEPEWKRQAEEKKERLRSRVQ
ncbi:hypothetical protein CHS0354_000116 [Potamilus streckersoni]|uniref:Uncharacterized protein n=1 Tax=Potamilus streckersoni TaxID=2493646 RepID=A0AAE0VLY6_9BIVA|nr:hypothetical protein CHS0354_000116 [Potamilus streckersoni]